MTYVFADFTKEVTTTTGLGTYSLEGAFTGHQSFVAGVGAGNACYYAITDGTDWEVGTGTVTSGTPDTLSRDTILASSNGGAAVNWSAGAKYIYCVNPATNIPETTAFTKTLLDDADAATARDTLGAAGRKNAFINGNFDIWQRDTNQTTTGYASDDRWVNSHSGSTKTHSRQAFTLGQTDVPGNPKYYSRTEVNSVAGLGNYVLKVQRIEGVRTFAGETVTLSFWAKADATKNMAIEFYQHFGTGGTPSAVVTGIGAQKFALTTTWQKFTATVSIPSISGKTLGTDGNDFFALYFWFDAGSSYDTRTVSLGQQSGTFDIAQVQLEKGSVATDFEYRTIAEELALCHRYYEKRDKNNKYINSAHVGAYENSSMGYVAFAVEKRVTPTITVFSEAGTAGAIDEVTTATEITGVTISGDPKAITRAFKLGAFTVGYVYSFGWIADAEL